MSLSSPKAYYSVDWDKTSKKDCDCENIESLVIA